MRFRSLFLSHGGGPLPLLGDAAHEEMVTCLKTIAGQIQRPQRIIMVSAHWESAQVTITSGAAPSLIYDYSGFPPESYAIEYPCPGAPTFAADVAATLQEQNIAAQLEPTRGFDHGHFVPMKIMYPEADIPCIQVSLLYNLDAAAHINLGRALRAVADTDVLLIGSGFSFHNLPAFFAAGSQQAEQQNQDFEEWLYTSCTDAALSETEREQRLIQWEAAPAARFCHPREEHLLPLHVCYGYGGVCTDAYRLRVLNKQSSMYLWETA